MDSLLRRKTLDFSIDEIYKREDNLYTVKIIPDIKSEYFPAYHLREINIDKYLLEESFYNNHGTDDNSQISTKKFKGSVVQGAYYSIDTNKISHMDIFSNKIVINDKNDIFESNKKESPYSNINISKIKVLGTKDGCELLSREKNKNEKNMYLYCFNVGQGDSLLFITTNNNAYLIDTNITSKENAKKFYCELKLIMRNHNIKSISGFIVTHKHLDHIRGADKFISDSDIKIDNFLINMEYVHETQPVQKLLKQASLKIPIWININSQERIIDGSTEIIFKNPDSTTSTKINSPDINNSSIVICARYKNTVIYLTGDASFKILNSKLVNCVNQKYKSMLKISHHGSCTGTDNNLLDSINPNFAFILAGNHNRFKHPDKSVISLLKGKSIDFNISKIVKKTISYEFDGNLTINKFL